VRRFKEMKKMLALMMAGILMICCSIAGAETEDPFRTMILSVLEDGEELEEMYLDDLSDLLGIEPSQYVEALWLMGDGLDGREVLVIRAVDEENAEEIREMLEIYLELRRKETQNYLPEAFQLLKAAEVLREDDLLMLIVGRNAQKEIKALIAAQ